MREARAARGPWNAGSGADRWYVCPAGARTRVLWVVTVAITTVTCPCCLHLLCAGVSLGGMITWLTAAADPRITAAAPLIGVQSFAWALQHDAWHARVDSIPLVFKVAAADMGRKEVGGERFGQSNWNVAMQGKVGN